MNSSFVSHDPGRSLSVAKLEALSAARIVRHCSLCPGNLKYYREGDFLDHLRREHSKKEGGSFVCRYGPNNVCQTLPLEGVSGPDFEDHIKKIHLLLMQLGTRPSSSSEQSCSVTNVPCLVKDSQTDVYNVYSNTQNLSSVLSDPNKSRREIQVFFTRHWGDSFCEVSKAHRNVNLPLISHLHFTEYAQSIGKRHDRHLRDEKRMIAHLQRNSCPLIGSGGHDFAYQVKHGSSDKDRIKPDLSSIPKIFLSSKFDLTDRDQFETVFLCPQICGTNVNNDSGATTHICGTNVNNESGAKPRTSYNNIFLEDNTFVVPLNHNKLLHEKLGHYLEVIECQIDRQISSQSAAFFHAMTWQDQLQTYLAQTKYAVQRLRKHILQLDTTLVKKGFSAVMLQQSRFNRAKLLDKLRLIATVKETQPTVQMLLNSCDYLGALDIIGTTQEVLGEELGGLVSFRHLNLQLCELSNVISKMLQEEFVNDIKTEINQLFENEVVCLDCEDSLTSVLIGLFRVKEYRFGHVLKQEINSNCIQLVRNTVRDFSESDGIVSEAESVAESVANTNLGDQLRKMEFHQWIQLLQLLFLRLLRFARKIELIEHLLLDMLDIAGGRALPSNHSFNESVDLSRCMEECDYLEVHESVSRSTQCACSVAQERIVKVVLAKARDGFIEKCSAGEIAILAKEIDNFTIECEKLSKGKKETVLKSCLLSQTSKMVGRFNLEKKAKLGNILDSEQWKVAQVPPLFQDLVDNCVKCGKLRDVEHREGVPREGVPREGVPQEGDTTPLPYLVVDGHTYVLVGTSLLLVQMLAQYCALLDHLPWMSADLLLGMVDLLKNFNSRTCQLILGAGALQLVGLKTISARNLALASRCLQFISRFIPIVRVEFESHLSQQNAHLKRHFNSVIKDYQDHIQEIFSKLLSILESVVANTLQNWDLRPPAPSSQFQQIAKQIKKFHDSIRGIFPDDQLQKLFLRFHDAFKILLRERLKQLNVAIHGSSYYSFVCSEFGFYMETMRSLACVASLNDSLTDILVDK